jgi:hypothetical protein
LLGWLVAVDKAESRSPATGSKTGHLPDASSAVRKRDGPR